MKHEAERVYIDQKEKFREAMGGIDMITEALSSATVTSFYNIMLNEV